MSHRKFEQPRHGSLGFLPRKRTRRHRGRIRSFPKDDASKAPHFTAYCGFKAGMTHITRELIRPASRLHKKEIVEAVTIIETPPMKVVGLVGYIETPRGLRALTTVWCSSLDNHFKRRMYKNWYSSKKKAFSKYIQNFSNDTLQTQLNRLKNYCVVIRAICQSQPHLVAHRSIKKAHILEVQINGGTVAQKVDYAAGFFEKTISVNDVLAQDGVVDVIGVTKGHGFTGPITRWGAKILPRKTHRGSRRVGCVGSWHPANVQFTVARAGQHGYHHRTERGKKIYRIGKAANSDPAVTNNATTDADLTEKNITPMGGFPRYGVVRHDYVMLKGCCVGVKKRALILRLPIHDRSDRLAKEKIELKFIDTSSKLGHGRFQTAEEKAKFYGRVAAQ